VYFVKLLVMSFYSFSSYLIFLFGFI